MRGGSRRYARCNAPSVRILAATPAGAFMSSSLDNGRRSSLAPVLILVPLLVASLGSFACGGGSTSRDMPADAVLVQMKGADSNLMLEALGEAGPPIVAVSSLAAEGEAPLLRVPVPAGRDAEELARQLNEQAGVEFAEPVFRYHTQRTPNDPRLKDLWGLEAIAAPTAWSKTVGERATVVAIVDDGVALNHPDLKDNIWVNPEEIAGNGIDDDGDGYIDDVNGWNFVDDNNDPSPAGSGAERFHGSHVSGTIGAVGDNRVGVVGVNWRVSLMALRAIGPQGGRADDLARAIDYATDHGARVINASWGGGGNSQVIAKAIRRAERHGVLFAAAAGNDGAVSPGFPASLAIANIISVGAFGADGALASFSDRGALVAAPGVAILSTTAPGKYERYDGTSMATPHVAGLAALLWSAHPSATLQQVKNAILASAVPMEGARHGRIDAARALDALVGAGGGASGALVLSRDKLTFKTASGKVPRAQSVSVRAEGGGKRRWKASVSAKWLTLVKAAGTTPSRLSVKVVPTGLRAGIHEAQVRVEDESSPTPTTLTVSLLVGSKTGAVAQGAECRESEGTVFVKAGTSCTLSAPGFDLDAALAPVRWRLPDGSISTGPRLVARFARKGEFRLEVSSMEGEREFVPVVVE